MARVDGKLIISAWTQCEGTNIGRANERTPEQQSVFEVDANYKKKLDKDYHLTMDAIDEGSHIYECMLAEDYTKRLLKKVSKTQPEFKHDEMYAQPKLDGMRCPTLLNGMWSRKGKPVVSCPHIFGVVEPKLKKYSSLLSIDGELYNHEFKEDFNEIMSIFKQTKPDADDLAKSKKWGQYHVYDCQFSDNPDMPFGERSAFLKQLVEEINSPYVVYVRTDKVNSKEHLDSLYFDEYLAEGYEGQMIRSNTAYENKRTWNLLKRKEFFTAEYKLLDILTARGNWEGKARKAVLEYSGGTFEADITGTMAFCETLLKEKDKYIGKPTTVRYPSFTPSGKPRFGKCKEFDRMDV